MPTNNAQSLINSISIGTAILSLFGRSGARVGAGLGAGLVALLSMAEINGGRMIFELEKEWIYVALALGIIFTLFVGYFFKFQEYKKEHNQADLKFDIKYVIALVVSFVFAGIVSYILTFKGLGFFLTDVVIDDNGFAFIMCFAIGAIIAYVIDAYIWHPVVDGYACTVYNKKQAELLHGVVAKSPEVVEKIKAIAKAKGLIDEAKLMKLVSMVETDKDPYLIDYIEMLKKH